MARRELGSVLVGVLGSGQIPNFGAQPANPRLGACTVLQRATQAAPATDAWPQPSPVAGSVRW